MKLPVELTPAAVDELEAAVAWYENEQAGVGGRLKEAVFATIKLIQNHPITFPRIYGDVRRARVKAFPYPVMYTVAPASIRVIAVFHAHRNPSDWVSRIPK